MPNTARAWTEHASSGVQLPRASCATRSRTMRRSFSSHWPILLLICLFTGLVTFKPSEPFLVAFLDCDKSISPHNVIHAVFPVWSYSYLGLLPFVCAAAELIGHKPVVILGAACRLITVLLLLWPMTDGSVMWMQLSQATIAVGFAAHPALSAIMYRGLPREAYTQGAGLVASTGVLAEVVASLLGQLLISQMHVQLYVLMIMSAISTGAGLLVALLLPTRQMPRPAASLHNLLLLPNEEGSASASPNTPFGALGRSINTIDERSERPSGCSEGDATAGAPSAAKPIGAGGGASSSCAGGPIGVSTASAGAPFAEEVSGSTANGGDSPFPSTRALLLLRDTWHTLRHSGAAYYYIWLSVATAVHHLVVTYWQAAVPNHHHHSVTDHPPPPPPSSTLLIGAFRTDPSPLIGLLSHPLPMLPPPASPPLDDLLTLDDLGNSSRCDHPAGESANGYTVAIGSLLGGCAALLPMVAEKCCFRSRQSAGCSTLRDVLMVFAPLVLAALLYLMSVVQEMGAYATGYITFHVGFELMRVVCEAEGARCVASYRKAGAPRFAAVSGLNTTLALVLQVLLQLFVNQPHRLEPQTQFQVFAAVFLALFVGYAALGVYRVCRAVRGPAEDRSTGGSETAEGQRYQRYAGPASESE